MLGSDMVSVAGACASLTTITACQATCNFFGPQGAQDEGCNAVTFDATAAAAGSPSCCFLNCTDPATPPLDPSVSGLDSYVYSHNAALKRPTEQYSTGYFDAARTIEYRSDYAVDGETTTNLQSTDEASPADDVWWQVQIDPSLTDEFAVSKVYLYGRNDDCASRLFEENDNGACSWTTSSDNGLEGFSVGVVEDNAKCTAPGKKSEAKGMAADGGCSTSSKTELCETVTTPVGSGETHRYEIDCDYRQGSWLYIYLQNRDRVLQTFEVQVYGYNPSTAADYERVCAAGTLDVAPHGVTVSHGGLGHALTTSANCPSGYGGSVTVGCHNTYSFAVSGGCFLDCPAGTVSLVALDDGSTYSVTHSTFSHGSTANAAACPSGRSAATAVLISCSDGVATVAAGDCRIDCPSGSLAIASGGSASHGTLSHGATETVDCDSIGGGLDHTGSGVVLGCRNGTTSIDSDGCVADCAAGTFAVADGNITHGAIASGTTATVACDSSTSSGSVVLGCTNGIVSLDDGNCFRSCPAGTVLSNGIAIAHPAMNHSGSVAVECPQSSTDIFNVGYSSTAIVECDRGSATAAGLSCSPDCPASTIVSNSLHVAYEEIPNGYSRVVACRGNDGSDGGASVVVPGEVKVECVAAVATVVSGTCDTSCAAGASALDANGIAVTRDSDATSLPSGGRGTASCASGGALVNVTCNLGILSVDEINDAGINPNGNNCSRDCPEGAVATVASTRGTVVALAPLNATLSHGNRANASCPDGYNVATAGTTEGADGLDGGVAAGAHLTVECTNGVLAAAVLEPGSDATSTCESACLESDLTRFGATYRTPAMIHGETSSEVACPADFSGSNLTVRCSDGAPVVVAGDCRRDCLPGFVASGGASVAHPLLRHSVDPSSFTAYCPVGFAGTLTLLCLDGQVVVAVGGTDSECTPDTRHGLYSVTVAVGLTVSSLSTSTSLPSYLLAELEAAVALDVAVAATQVDAVAADDNDEDDGATSLIVHIVVSSLTHADQATAVAGRMDSASKMRSLSSSTTLLDTGFSVDSLVAEPLVSTIRHPTLHLQPCDAAAAVRAAAAAAAASIASATFSTSSSTTNAPLSSSSSLSLLPECADVIDSLNSGNSLSSVKLPPLCPCMNRIGRAAAASTLGNCSWQGYVVSNPADRGTNDQGVGEGPVPRSMFQTLWEGCQGRADTQCCAPASGNGERGADGHVCDVFPIIRWCCNGCNCADLSEKAQGGCSDDPDGEVIFSNPKLASTAEAPDNGLYHYQCGGAVKPWRNVPGWAGGDPSLALSKEYPKFSVSSVQDCQSLCAETPRCVAVSWRLPAQGHHYNCLPTLDTWQQPKFRVGWQCIRLVSRGRDTPSPTPLPGTCPS